MPARKVASVEEFLARLDDVQRPHVEALRALSLEAAEGTEIVEALKFNFPAYAAQTMVWTLQVFKNHCSVRFPVAFFADRRDEAIAAGYDAIEGALTIRWDQEVPEAIVRRLLAERVDDYEAGHTAWSTPGQRAGPKK
ncbi:DUF1801 domain-containing protein [Aeromicrobium sp. CFBP 8757]|uniref:DUF1801 domain-containing protein n=1 Tax=Aeromicrobium sp. CFBP 8757 TaxID=2775288 RepID=UPI001786B804|nr:DUF1801 domain-containing protein [Aeromicrobium sp. CFBP 8757]MBD8607866.1 DUF1801 domain-containing protein [Aeromicrobium sp. CFBP 8757]